MHPAVGFESLPFDVACLTYHIAYEYSIHVPVREHDVYYQYQ